MFVQSPQLDSRFFEYGGAFYPTFGKLGPASRFIEKFALEFCRGFPGLHVGYGNPEWDFFAGRARLLDIADGVDCQTLDQFVADFSQAFIFSSHTLEHLENWQMALTNWAQKLRSAGCLFLYLPFGDMEYWQPQNNRKHHHVLYPELVRSQFERLGLRNIMVTGVDLYYSFCAVGFGGL